MCPLRHTALIKSKMKISKYLLATAVVGLSFTMVSCDGEKEGDVQWWTWNSPEEPKPEPEPEPEPVVDPNQAIIDLGWTNVGADYGELPEYISVFKAPETLDGKSAVAYIAVMDLTKGKWDVLGDLYYCDDKNIAASGADSANTPADFYEQTQAPVITNAGLYFYAEKSTTEGFYISQNLVIRDGEGLAPNQTYYSEDWVTIWYPTLGAFLQKEDGTCTTTWTYTDWTGVTYYYPAPADNSMDKDPLEVPSAKFPEGAAVLGTDMKVAQGIGGVGVLINKGEIVNTWSQELLNVAADSDQPRTAIGSTADNRLILFVCEGRNMTSGVTGLTTGNVANVMHALGCTEALNLDGGGSSCMLINGKETIKPSDGSQRAVLTGIRMF